MNGQGLQLLGLLMTMISVIIGFITWKMWKSNLPDGKKVWAIVLLIGWGGLLSTAYPIVLLIIGGPH